MYPGRVVLGEWLMGKNKIPTEEFVWTVLMRRIEQQILKRKLEILELCGFYEMFGRPGPDFTGEQEGEAAIKELIGWIVTSFAEDLQDRCDRARSEQKAGRPCDVLTREVGPKLLDFYLRYSLSAGRASVWTSVDGKLVQEESGPFFEFSKAALQPLNAYLEEMGWKPVSAARAARFALAERKRMLESKLKRAKRKMLSMAQS